MKFQDRSVRTTTLEGGAPLWKQVSDCEFDSYVMNNHIFTRIQSLKLPFRPPQDDFSPSTLASVMDEVRINNLNT